MDKILTLAWTEAEIANNRSLFLDKDRHDLWGIHYALRFGASHQVIKDIVAINPDALRERDKLGLLPIHYAANNATTTLEVFQYLVSQSPRSLRERDGLGMLPIHHISQRHTNVEIFQFFEKSYSDSIREKDKDGWLPIHHAAKGNSSAAVLEFLVLRYAGGLREATTFGSLPIHIAAHFNQNVSVLEYLVAQHPGGLKEKGTNDMLPIHSAARNNPSLEILEFLVVKSAEGLSEKDRNGRCPLHYAVRNPNALAVLRFLLDKHSAVVSQSDSLGWTPFHNAARYSVLADVLKLLLAYHPAAVDMKDADGWLPLHHAARSNPTLEISQYLVDVSPDTLSIANHDKYPHDLAPAGSDVKSYLTMFFCSMQLDGRDEPMDIMRVQILGDSGAGKSVVSKWIKQQVIEGINVELFDETYDSSWKAGGRGGTIGLEQHHVTLNLSDRVTHFVLCDYSGAMHHLSLHAPFLSAPDSVYLIVIPLYDKQRKMTNGFATMVERLLFWLRLVYSRAKKAQDIPVMILMNTFSSDLKISFDEVEGIRTKLLKHVRRYFTFRSTNPSMELDVQNEERNLNLYDDDYNGDTGNNRSSNSELAGLSEKKTADFLLVGGEILPGDFRNKFSLNKATALLKYAPLYVSQILYRQTRFLTYCWEVLNMIDLSYAMEYEAMMTMLASTVRSFFTKQTELDEIQPKRNVCDAVEARLLQHLIAFLTRLDKVKLLDSTPFYPQGDEDRIVVTSLTQLSRFVLGSLSQNLYSAASRGSAVDLSLDASELGNWVSKSLPNTAVPLPKLLTQLMLAIPLEQLEVGAYMNKDAGEDGTRSGPTMSWVSKHAMDTYQTAERYWLFSLAQTMPSCLESSIVAELKPLKDAQRVIRRGFRLLYSPDSPLDAIGAAATSRRASKYTLIPGYLRRLFYLLCASFTNQVSLQLWQDGLKLIFRSTPAEGGEDCLTQILIVPMIAVDEVVGFEVQVSSTQQVMVVDLPPPPPVPQSAPDSTSKSPPPAKAAADEGEDEGEIGHPDLPPPPPVPVAADPEAAIETERRVSDVTAGTDDLTPLPFEEGGDATSSTPFDRSPDIAWAALHRVRTLIYSADAAHLLKGVRENVLHPLSDGLGPMEEVAVDAVEALWFSSKEEGEVQSEQEEEMLRNYFGTGHLPALINSDTSLLLYPGSLQLSGDLGANKKSGSWDELSLARVLVLSTAGDRDLEPAHRRFMTALILDLLRSNQLPLPQRSGPSKGLVMVSRRQVQTVLTKALELRANSLLNSSIYVERDLQDMPLLPFITRDSASDRGGGRISRAYRLSFLCPVSGRCGSGAGRPLHIPMQQRVVDGGVFINEEAWSPSIISAFELTVVALETALIVRPRNAQVAEMGSMLQDTLELLLVMQQVESIQREVIIDAKRLFRIQGMVFKSLKRYINSASQQQAFSSILIDESKEHLVPLTSLPKDYNQGIRLLMLAANDPHLLHTGLQRVSDPLTNVAFVSRPPAPKAKSMLVSGQQSLTKLMNQAVAVATGEATAANTAQLTASALSSPSAAAMAGSSNCEVMINSNGNGFGSEDTERMLSEIAKEFMRRGQQALLLRLKY